MEISEHEKRLLISALGLFTHTGAGTKYLDDIRKLMTRVRESTPEVISTEGYRLMELHPRSPEPQTTGSLESSPDGLDWLIGLSPETIFFYAKVEITEAL